MFLTLTCPSYGRVHDDGTPADPAAYDYQRRPGTRCTSPRCSTGSSRTCAASLGYDVQYFAAIEPQRRLAPHVHIAIRGTFSRAELRQVLAATYHQVWWPPANRGQVPRRRAAGLARGQRQLPRPRHRGTPAHLGPGPRRHRRRRRAAARGQVRGQVRRPGRARRITRRQPVHRLPDQVPHQAPRRLPPGRRPAPSTTTPSAWSRRCATSRARRGARTGCATASSPRTPGPACGPDTAGARPTAASTSATPGAASWSPASGPARPSPTTAPTARHGSWPPSASPTPTPPATPGNPSPPATPTTCHPPNGCCTSSPTGNAGTPPSPKPDDEPTALPIFRQLRPEVRPVRVTPREQARQRTEGGTRQDGSQWRGVAHVALNLPYGKGTRMLTLGELCELAEHHRAACAKAGRAGRHSVPEGGASAALSGGRG